MRPAFVLGALVLGALAASAAYAWATPKLPASEQVPYYTAGGAKHVATIERRPGSAPVMVLDDVPGGKREVSLVFDAVDPGAGLVASTTTAEAFTAYALLAWFKKHGKPYGSRIEANVDGHRIVAKFEEHPADKGTPYPHPGVTLLEKASVV